MRQNDDLTPGDRGSHAPQADLLDCDRPLMDSEHLVEMGHRARQEVERFINGHIADSTKGWPVLSRTLGRDGETSCPPDGG